MARPTSPLVTRDSATRAALDLIDEQGLDDFSLPALARRMGVSTPALYHHFRDRTDVLSEVARLILSAAVTPPQPDDLALWEDWVLASSLNLREAVLKHRNAAPVLLRFLPRDLVTQRYEEAAEFFTRVGIPRRLHIPLMDGIEKLSLGAIIAEAMEPRERPDGVFPSGGEASYPALAAANAVNRLTAERLHSAAIASFIRGVMLDGATDPGT